METIIERIAKGSDDAPAILAPERPALTHGGLRRLMADTVARLNGLGIGRGDRVAIVLRQRAGDGDRLRRRRRGGHDGAAQPRLPRGRVRLLPLRPRRQGADRRSDEAGQRCRRRTARHRRSSASCRTRADRPGGSRWTALADRRPPRGRASAEADDIALLLHTSGTTSRPKIVPLTHANLAASAANIGATLRLTPDDRCLNIMPLFHIHGLVAAVLASLAAGGSVVCTPGFNALQLLRAGSSEAKPTWYTAVPTMHQAILPRAERNAEVDRARDRCASSARPRPRCRRR